MGSGLANSGRLLIESGAVTAVAGFAAFGILTRSVGLSTMFCQKVAAQLLYAIYPILTRLDENGGGLVRVGGLVIRLVVWIVVPVAVLLAVLAAPVVHVVYGPKWIDVTPLLPWAMAWGAFGGVSHSAYMLLLARQQARLCLLSDLGLLVATALALGLALPHGTYTYLVVLVVAQVILVSILLFFLVRCASLSVAGLVDAFVPPMVAGFLSWGALATLQNTLGWAAPQTFLEALSWGAAFCLFHLLVLRIGFKRQLIELIAYFPARRTISRILFIDYPS